MKTQSNSKLSTFNKSVLSITIISVITGGLFALENYRTEKERGEFSDQVSLYTDFEKVDEELLVQNVFYNNLNDSSLTTTDINQLAKIAEQNLLLSDEKAAPDVALIAQDNAPKVDVIAKQSISKEPTTNSKLTHHQSANNKSKAELSAEHSAEVLFELSSTKLTPEYKLVLIEMAEKIKAESNALWQIVGHTDRSGRAAYNLKLAQQRAKNVLDFLKQQGVNENNLTLVSLGEYQATQSKSTAYNRNLRKVEVLPYQANIEKLALTLHKRNKVDQVIQVAAMANTKTEENNVNIKQQNASLLTDKNSSLLTEQNKAAQKTEVASESDKKTDNTKIEALIENKEQLMGQPMANKILFNSSITLANNTSEQPFILMNYNL